MLSSEQKSAVEAQERHVRVTAGAGSGKTRVIVHRALELVKRGIAPESVTIITYTNASAVEIKDRIDSEIGDSPMFVGTMNSFALKSLSESTERGTFADFDRRGWASRFPNLWSIVDENAVEDAIRTVRDEYGKKVTLKAVRAGLYSDLNEKITSVKGNRERKARVQMRSLNQLSQDDLVVMLADGAHTLDIEHLIVDEAQDLPHAHKRFVDNVAESSSVFVCQDDAQSIFSFLAKRQEACGIPAYQYQHFKPTEYQLTTNFRSYEAVVSAANQLRARLADDEACSLVEQKTSDLGGEVVTLEFDEVTCLADYTESIPDEVLSEISFEFLSSSSCALICRTWKDVNLFKPHLSKAGLIDSANMSLSLSLPANRGLLALARIIQRGSVKLSDLDDIRSCAWSAPKGSLLQKTAELCDLIRVVYSEEVRTPLGDVVESFTGSTFWSEVGSIKTFDNLAESWQEIGGMPSPLLHHFADQDDLSALIAGAARAEKSSSANKVVTTAHGAKGLEWDTVIVYGAVDGIFPSSRDKTQDLINEAGRALYVAMTRARQRLVLLKPASVRNKPRELSRFLAR